MLFIPISRQQTELPLNKDLLPTCTTKPKHVHVKLEFECVQKVNTKYKNI